MTLPRDLGAVDGAPHGQPHAESDQQYGEEVSAVDVEDIEGREQEEHADADEHDRREGDALRLRLWVLHYCDGDCHQWWLRDEWGRSGYSGLCSGSSDGWLCHDVAVTGVRFQSHAVQRVQDAEVIGHRLSEAQSFRRLEGVEHHVADKASEQDTEEGLQRAATVTQHADDQREDADMHESFCYLPVVHGAHTRDKSQNESQAGVRRTGHVRDCARRFRGVRWGRGDAHDTRG